MVHQNTIKYLVNHKDFRKIAKSIKFYIFDKIKRKKIDKTKNEIVVNNCKMKILPDDDGISSELIIYGIHEPLTTKLILDEIKKDMTVLDIGSNIGYYAILESKLVGPSGKVFSIEPSPKNFELLEENLKLQKMNNFQLFNLAIGSKNEKLEFVISGKSNWSKIKEKNDIIGKNDKIITVLVKPLDLFCEENLLEKIDLIRMDVEGYEENIIAGGKETLRKFKPTLMIEIHKMYLGKERTKKILNELYELGYEIKHYFPRIFDTPIIADMKDIKKSSINMLLKELDANRLPEAFQITLIKK